MERRLRGWLALAVAFSAACSVTIVGCDKAKPNAAAPAKVGVAKPISRDVMEWDEYTARLEAVDEVAVRARISGYLQEVKFREGAIIHKGDLLFVIDARPYEAVLRRAEADQGVAQARRELAEKRYQRAASLVSKNAISKEEADTRLAEWRQAEASVAAAVAAVEAARLDVEFTKIHSPVGGRVGRKLVTEGNLINGGPGTQGTLLTTVVSLDPIHAYFEVDERSYLKYVRLSREGVRPSSRDTANPVEIGFADEEGFPHKGAMDFVDNRIDNDTGTITGRAILPNPDMSLSPGLFARLRLIGSGEYHALMIPDEAVAHDQAQTFVLVAGPDNKAEYRKITTGPMVDGLRVVRSGLAAEDRIIVSGTQRVRPGVAVDPVDEPIKQPTPAGATPPAVVVHREQAP